jgi:hypothetical protein
LSGHLIRNTKNFCSLRNEIITFLEVKQQAVAEIQNTKWIQDQAGQFFN